MPASSSPLQDLRDVHLPDPISLWPPALGWWIVFGLMVAGVIVFIWMRAYRYRTKARRLAMAELGAVKQHYKIHKNDQWVVQRLSEITRRYAMANFPRTEVAGLVGSSWLGFLDRTGGTNQFTEGVGHVLSSGPYQPQSLVPAADLLPLVERWIQHVSPPTRRNTA
ncbi:MAG: DUF4381 domain-containing protein [Nitrospirota bacterium]|jgi:hypothetical protein|nr:DUF4381 domain-containing protein [Nitrospirota bacterium]MDH5575225.1 DUF4381 domain-containing protein [Nitrospirota bacterium]